MRLSVKSASVPPPSWAVKFDVHPANVSRPESRSVLRIPVSSTLPASKIRFHKRRLEGIDVLGQLERARQELFQTFSTQMATPPLLGERQKFLSERCEMSHTVFDGTTGRDGSNGTLTAPGTTGMASTPARSRRCVGLGELDGFLAFRLVGLDSDFAQ